MAKSMHAEFSAKSGNALPKPEKRDLAEFAERKAAHQSF